MDAFGLIAVGMALAMDVIAVSMVNGMVDRRIGWRRALASGGLFGLFQGGFFLLGYLVGFFAFSLISGVDHWIAFGLLALIGGKMIIESFDCKTQGDSCSLTNQRMIAQSVATSIDALAVGVGMVVLEINVALGVFLVGLISFVFGFVSIWIGKRFGALCGKKPELVGGLILIGIGLNLLIRHLMN
jgi:putative Mn2+ efflux pump MntP